MESEENGVRMNEETYKELWNFMFVLVDCLVILLLLRDKNLQALSLGMCWLIVKRWFKK